MTRQRYVLLSLATMVMVAGLTFASTGSAQSVTPLSCTTGTPVVNVNQTAFLTASGGNGSYTWSGSNLSLTNPIGPQLSVSYPNPGTYLVNVSSAGQIAGCSLTVLAGTTNASGTLMCSPAFQTVALGQTAQTSATGGNGSYVWSSPDLLITNSSGPVFNANYSSTGMKTLTVSSGGSIASCSVNVISNAPTGNPGLPNTGGGYGH